MMNKLFFIITCAVFLSSCSSVSVQDYKNEKPEFQFDQFFNGDLEANGFFQDRSGKIVKRIHCEMKAHTEDGVTTVDEKFTYSDGTKDERTWKIAKNAEGFLEGRAGDVSGAAKIETAGFSFHMNYILHLKVDGKILDVHMDDWMYRMNDKTVLNKTSMSKWGFHLGDVTLEIHKK